MLHSNCSKLLFVFGYQVTRNEPKRDSRILLMIETILQFAQFALICQSIIVSILSFHLQILSHWLFKPANAVFEFILKMFVTKCQFLEKLARILDLSWSIFTVSSRDIKFANLPRSGKLLDNVLVRFHVRYYNISFCPIMLDGIQVSCQDFQDTFFEENVFQTVVSFWLSSDEKLI